jgi:hypothetical protein
LERFDKRPVQLGLLGDLMDRLGVRRPYPRMEGDFPLGLALDYLRELSDRIKAEPKDADR